MAALGFDEARVAIITAVRPGSTEAISLWDALGRTAAERIVADADAVPFSRSAMDGYAVRAADCSRATDGSHATREHPVVLPVVGSVFAEKGEATLAPGAALVIATGAPLPRGADAVIPHEQTERCGAAVRIFAPVEPGDCVFPAGEDIRRGDELLTAGEVLHAGKLGLLAFAGKSHVGVYRRPRVAIVCTGEELVDPAATPAHGQVRNSNAIMLAALVAEAGGEPRIEGIVPDNAGALGATLKRAHGDADILITTGGASAGERDLVKGVLTSLGARFEFTQVAMRPGKPFGFALWGEMPVCVLPGSPAAAFICFHQLVRPALGRLTGRSAIELPRIRARLEGEMHGRPGRRYFVLARLDLAPDGFVVMPLVNQCSALVRTAADANAIVTVRETSDGSVSKLSSGDLVDVDVLAWPSLRGSPLLGGNL